MSNEQNNRPGFFRRFFGLLIRSLLLVLLLLLLGIGGLFLFNEAVISSNNFRASLNAFESRVNLLRSDVDNLMAIEREQRQTTAELRTDTSNLEVALNALANNLSSQNEALAALETALATAVADNEAALTTLQENLQAQQEGLLALQGDLNESNASIDALGGELDGVRGDFNMLRQENQQLAGDVAADIDALSTQVDDALAVVATNTAEMVELQRTVRLFRVWELVTRARLQLVEGNVGLARNDLNQVVAVVEQMIAMAEAEADEELVAGLTAVQLRLELALTNLDTSAQLAARDLETAWDLLDDLLADRLLTDFTLPETDPETETDPEAAEEPDADEDEDAETEEDS